MANSLEARVPLLDHELIDLMTMANSLEARVPLLDHELIEFVQTIPAELKLKGFETKYIFKKALEGIVPNEILYREKQGFGVPIGDWINSQLKDRIHSRLCSEKKHFRARIFRRKIYQNFTRRTFKKSPRSFARVVDFMDARTLAPAVCG